MFTLPPLSQDQFSTYYGKQIENKETIVYPGVKLNCTSQTKNLKRFVKPENIFITKKGNNFFHRVLGSDNQWSILPKRLHSVCFPKINLTSVPKHNRIKIQLSDTIYEILPYIPDEFHKTKMTKAERNSKPITRRNKRKRSEMKTQNIKKHYTGWEIEGIQNNKKITKQEIMQKIKSCMHYAKDKLIHNPFEAGMDNKEAKQAFASVVQFVHHYAREEFNMHIVKDEYDQKVWDEISSLI